MKGRYQQEIEKILKLQYEAQSCKIDKRIGLEIITRFAARIGHEYQLPPMGTIDEKVLLIHGINICGEIPKCDDCEINLFCKHHRRNAVREIEDNDLTMIDLFSGAGGFSLGFSQNGFKTIFAVDNQTNSDIKSKISKKKE